MPNELIRLVLPYQSENLDEIIQWLKENEKENNICKLCVVFENKDGEIHSRSLNLLNKDYAWFLVNELFNLIIGNDND